jgi:AcrR family transcriptional regulator
VPTQKPDIRSDRRRNQSRIVAAARTVILAKGRAAAMDDIAAEAGLAVGTLYRHFRTKDELVDAILAELAHEIDELVATYERSLSTPAADAARLLEDLLRHVVLDLSAARLLREALDGSEDRLAASRGRATALLSNLLGAAQDNGTVPDELSVADLVLMFRTAPGDRFTAEERERWLTVVLRGIRTPQ